MRLVLIGAPNSGKGIQSCLIAEKYSIPRLAMNELIRQAVSDNTLLGQQAKYSIDLDKTIPDEVLLGLIEERINLPDARQGFILDGFPTNMDQAQALDNLLQKQGRPIHIVILLDTDFDALMQRVTGRLSCRSCGHVCNFYTDPPKMDGQCDECGGNLRQRPDDDEEIISNRLRIYEIQMTPVIEYYREQQRLRSVQGIGEVDDIFAAIQGVIESTDMDEEPIPSVEALEKIILEKAQKAQGDTAESDESEETAPAKEAPAKPKTVKKQAAKKKAVSKKTSPKKATAKKKVTTKKQTAKKKTAAKKKTVKKASPVKKKTVAKKSTTKKKAVTKKIARKKSPVKKAAPKKKTVSKKAITKKKAAKASPRKKTVAKKSVKKKKAPVKKKKR